MTKFTKHLLSITTVCTFFILAIASSDDKKIEKEVSEQEATQPAIQVSATQLYADYEANEIAADQKYKGKVLVVSGTIGDIAKDIADDIYVTLKGDDVIGDVQCFFSEAHTSTAAQLQKGQKITVKGKCDGKMMNVILRGCSVQ